MDELDKEALDPKWFNEYYEFFDDDDKISDMQLKIYKLQMGEEDAKT